MLELLPRDDKMIATLANKLEVSGIVEFKHNNLYYEICEAVDTGYMVDIYSSDERYDEDEFMDQYKVDGGLCTGTAKDAIEFMLPIDSYLLRDDFKVGDTVINKSRNNTQYVLDYCDLIRFKDEELELVSKG